MARRLRQVSQAPLSIDMADEEQPFLNPDPWTETKRTKSWFRCPVILKRWSIQIAFMIFSSFIIVLIYTM